MKRARDITTLLLILAVSVKVIDFGHLGAADIVILALSAIYMVLTLKKGD